MVTTYKPNGKSVAALGANDNAAVIRGTNKKGEDIVDICADDYGNGIVGAYKPQKHGQNA